MSFFFLAKSEKFMRENVLKFIVDDVRRTVENQLTWPMNVSPPRRKVWRPHLFSIFVFRRVSAPVNVPKITRKWNPSAILMFTRLGGGVVRPPIATLSPPAPTFCYPNYPVLVSLSLIYWLLLVYYCYYYFLKRQKNQTPNWKNTIFWIWVPWKHQAQGTMISQ